MGATEASLRQNPKPKHPQHTYRLGVSPITSSEAALTLHATVLTRIFESRLIYYLSFPFLYTLQQPKAPFP